MKLDEKIEYKPLDCFDVDSAKKYEGQKGYFHNYLESFSNLSYCTYGTLEVNNDETATKIFHLAENDHYYKFFLPDTYLKKKEKKLRPYTVAEFQDIFKPGYPIRFRPKDQSENEEMLLIFNGYKTIQGVVFIYFGHFAYTLNQLFEDYEWQEHYTEDFKPFGVEE